MSDSDNAIMFCLTDEDQQKIKTWYDETVMPNAVKTQKEHILPSHPHYDVFQQCWEAGYVYTGINGGNLSYTFTPTSLGIVVKVKDSITNLELDLTDYDSW